MVGLSSLRFISFSCLFDNERFGIQDVRNLEVSEDNFDVFQYACRNGEFTESLN